MPGRTDQVDDPQIRADLLLARRGTAFFSRKLNELSDADLDGPSLLAGWGRRHVVAHVGYNARALTRLTEWAATGIETPMYEPGQRDEEIAFGATLSPLALRNLSDHAVVHLNVEWRDLPRDAWDAEVRTVQGRTVPVSETVWMRSREVWLHAIDLDNGARMSDLPAEFIDRLLVEIVALWTARGNPVSHLELRPTDRDSLNIRLDDDASEPTKVLSGPAAQLLAWATGRRHHSLLIDGETDPIPAASRWL
jgi:maleylpyruvate isomerase